MPDSEPPLLGDDQPKENPHEQDKLGYAPFAKRVAQTIIRMQAPNGYVIGLHGRWGSGKSTMLNFIKHHIDKYNEESYNTKLKITVVDFRPWIVAGHQDLIAAFFKILAESLGNPDPWYKRFLKWILRFFRAGSDSLIESVSKVGALVDPSGGVAVGASTGIIRSIVGFFTNRFLAEPSLQKIYENLKLQLQKDGRRFVAVIDDLDRLQDEEVRSIMQMVKTVGRLPNLVYILVYDRQIVGRALDGLVAERDGPSFAEKIVQQELELPRPGRQALLKMLDQEIAFIGNLIPESERWSFIAMDGIHYWVRNPRDVVRYANALKFSWPALEGEFDPADLFAIEGLKLFEPGVFNWIRENRDFLFNDGQFSFAKDKLVTEAVGALKRRVPEERQETVLRLLDVMFPQKSEAFLGSEAFGNGESNTDTQSRRGIGSANGYDTYFSLHVPAEIIPKSILTYLVEKIEDEAEIEYIFRSYIDRISPSGAPMIGFLLEELQFRYRGRRPIRPSPALLNVLLRNGEKVLRLNEHKAILQLSPAARFAFLIDDILQGWSLDEASKYLINAFQQASSPAVLADVFVDRGRELDVFERGGRTSHSPRITPEAFEELGAVVLQRIQAAAADRTLANAPMYFDIVRAWKYLAGPDEPKAWVEEGIFHSAEFLVKIGLGMVSFTVGTKHRAYTMRDNPEPEVFDLSKIREAASKHLSIHLLSDDERTLLKELVRGADRALKGLPHPSFSGDEDDSQD